MAQDMMCLLLTWRAVVPEFRSIPAQVGLSRLFTGLLLRYGKPHD